MIPYKLKLHNFLSYVDEEVEFSTLDPIILINGLNSEASSGDDNNGAGKSALLDAIEWVLYARVRGVLSKELIKDDIIHMDEDGSRARKVRVEFVFEMDDGYYKVIREKALEGPSVLEVRYSKDLKLWKNLTRSAGVNNRSGKKESSIKRTQQKIDDVLNANCDLFINSAFFEQMNTNTYALAGGSAKSDLLRQALYLDKWTDYAAVKKMRLKSVEKEISHIEYQLDQNKPDDIKDKIDEMSQILTDCKAQKKSLADEIKALEAECRDLSKRLGEIEGAAKLKDAAVARHADFTTQVSRTKERIHASELRIDRHENKKAESTDAIQEAKDDVEKYSILASDSKKEHDALDIDEVDYTVDSDSIKKEIAQLQGEVRAITNQKDTFTSDCPIVASNCSRGSEEAHAEKIKKINGKIFKINGVISAKKKTLVALDKIVTIQNDQKAKKSQAYLTYTGYESVVRDRKQDLERHKANIATVDADVVDLKKQLKTEKTDLVSTLEKLKVVTDELATFKEFDVSIIKDALGDSANSLKRKQEKLKSVENQYVRAEQTIESNQTRLGEMKEIQENFNELNDRRQILSYSIRVLSKDIPHQLIESALPEIESYAQEYLTELSVGRMNLELKTQKDIQQKDKDTKENLQKDDLYMELETDGVAKKYALCSGGEKTRADIAIHLGYATFMLNRSGAKIRSLYFDEVGMALDDTGKKALVALLNRLVTEVGFKKIFVISQDEKFNKLFNCTLTVKKTSAGSKICLN